MSNYASLALLEIAYRAVQPLFLSTPIEFGGLGLPPPTIGLILGSFGVFNGIVQALLFAKLVDRYGPKRIFQFGMSMFVPLWVLYPVMSVLAKTEGMTTTVWALVFFQLALSVLMDMAYGAYLAGLLPSLHGTLSSEPSRQGASSSSSRGPHPTRARLARLTALRSWRLPLCARSVPQARRRCSRYRSIAIGLAGTVCTRFSPSSHARSCSSGSRFPLGVGLPRRTGNVNDLWVSLACCLYWVRADVMLLVGSGLA